ncbi:MAG: (5-formylfuran-3-yl)methyl phosphate synthase [Planctomycetota bacterium]
MTGLLVSVRDASEARAALSAGVDLIDIKEPRAGSLGPADVDTWREIATVVGAARPLSVALGELHDDGVCELARQAAGMKFAKIGLSRCHDEGDWGSQWQRAIACLPVDVASVAVIYADYSVARSPLPAVIVEHAIQFGCAAILFDTYSKSQGHLFDHLGERELLPLLRDAKQAGLKIVLGGSLRGELVRRALELEPDYIAVRGAVCRGDRRDAVDQSLIESLSEMIRGHSPTSC